MAWDLVSDGTGSELMGGTTSYYKEWQYGGAGGELYPRVRVTITVGHSGPAGDAAVAVFITSKEAGCEWVLALLPQELMPQLIEMLQLVQKQIEENLSD